VEGRQNTGACQFSVEGMRRAQGRGRGLLEEKVGGSRRVALQGGFALLRGRGLRGKSWGGRDVVSHRVLKGRGGGDRARNFMTEKMKGSREKENGLHSGNVK